MPKVRKRTLEFINKLISNRKRVEAVRIFEKSGNQREKDEKCKMF